MSWKAVFAANPVEWVRYKGQMIPVDPEPRTVQKFELKQKRPYVFEHGKRLYVVVEHVGPDQPRGLRAHPAVMEQK